jgi:hypothetical protein
MLLLPGLALLLAAALSMFQMGLDQIALEVSAFEAARSSAIGFEPEVLEAASMTSYQEGRFLCVRLEKEQLLPLSATSCMIPSGG